MSRTSANGNGVLRNNGELSTMGECLEYFAAHNRPCIITTSSIACAYNDV